MNRSFGLARILFLLAAVWVAMFFGTNARAADAVIPAGDAPILADAALDGMMLEWS